MKYLTVDNILFIHDEVLKRYGGGESGIFQDGYGKIESMLARMKEGFYGYHPFDTLLLKAAFQFQSILQYHPFVDGLKRTGIYSTISFLLMNDYCFYSKGVKEEVDFAIYVADELTQKNPEDALNEIVDWIKQRVFRLDDTEKVIEFVDKHLKRKCPRCGDERASMYSPFCKDCGLQLIRYDVHFDGIILERALRLERPLIKDLRVLISPKVRFTWSLREI